MKTNPSAAQGSCTNNYFWVWLPLLALLIGTASSVALADADLDGIPDNLDNCINVANPSQRDTNGDGYGNLCDADLTDDLIVNIGDLNAFKLAFGSADPDADFDGNGTVNVGDLNTFKLLFGAPPGPSCIDLPGGCTAASPNPTARGDSYATPRDRQLQVLATRLTGVLYNDFDPQDDPLTVVNVDTSGTTGTVTVGPDGDFTYTPPAGFQGDDQFTYQASDGTNLSDVATVNIRVLPDQPDFKFMMNYELGMHCTGFEFAYCCVLPVYNSILAQVVRSSVQSGSQTTINGADDFPRLLEDDPNLGKNLDVLGRHTVLRDPTLVGGNFPKYVVKYWHDAQSRNDGQGKPQVPGAVAGLPGYLNSATLISDVEGHSLLSWNTRADAASENPDNTLVLGGAECTNPADLSTCSALNVVQGDGSFGTLGHFPVPNTPVDNYQNAIWNHLYIFADTEGTRLCVSDPTVHCHTDADCAGVGGACGDSTEANKLRLGLDVAYPTNFGPAGHPMGPVTSFGASGPTFHDSDILGAHMTFSGETGTVVYTQMKVVENLPITLTSPRIWEALGLPLTPFEDTLGFFADPGLVDEDSIRPYVQMTAQLHEAQCGTAFGLADGDCQAGPAVIDTSGHPVQGFGTAPIDIPNCERCHSAFNDPMVGNAPNSPNDLGTPEAEMVQLEIDFWNAYYDIDTGAGDSDWYSRLKGAAISILARHDAEHGSLFLGNFPASGYPISLAGTPFDPLTELGGLAEPMPGAPASCLVNKMPTGPACSTHADCGAGTDGVCDLPQATRIGHESVLCHKCHADNVIAVVKSANCGASAGSCAEGDLIPPLTEAVHFNHRSVSEGGTITFSDSFGRDGACQGCHPAHRSDGVMDNYPIDLDGNNVYAAGDNRLAAGGCFVGRDVHSNPMKDVDAGTPNHLTALGAYLRTNVSDDTGEFRGIWCTNCHSQISQEIWKAENCSDLINGTCEGANPRGATDMADLAGILGIGLAQIESWADPKDPAIDPDLPISGPGTRTADDTHAIWDPDPGMCDHVASLFGAPANPAQDANVATIEVNLQAEPIVPTDCSTGVGLPGPDCDGNGNPDFSICGSLDADGDVTVAIMDFCTTPDCVAAAQATLTGPGQAAVPVPFSAATDGRDHWLAAGEPHCADCHAAPYVEQSGNVNAFAPFNYPRKASLMRYSRGHQDITCQGCHESIHGLYPVSATIDNTTYAQAASLNADGSHGPLKCGTCHNVNTTTGIPVNVCSPGDATGKCEVGAPGIRYDDPTTAVVETTAIAGSFDAAVGWMHTFTEEARVTETSCLNCHDLPPGGGPYGQNNVNDGNGSWLAHADAGRVTRNMMDKAEIELNGAISTATADNNGVCIGCHNAENLTTEGCSNTWKRHLTEGRVAVSVWEALSVAEIAGQPAADGTICGW